MPRTTITANLASLDPTSSHGQFRAPLQLAAPPAMDDCSINPARMAMMQTESREPVSGAMHGRGRGGFYRGGARQAHSRHRPNNGHGRNMMGASGENGKALGKIRNFGNRSSDEDATPVPSPVPLPATTNGALPTTNGAGQKRKRDTENGIIQEGVRCSKSPTSPHNNNNNNLTHLRNPPRLYC